MNQETPVPSGLESYHAALRAKREAALQRLAGQKKRSSYTAHNAEIFRGFFEEAATTRKDICVRYDEFVSNSPTTLLRKVTDARKYLLDKAPNEDERVKWTLIRAKTKIEMSLNPDEGIWIRWFDTFRNAIGHQTTEVKRALEDVASKRTLPWKERLMDWLESPEVGQVFSMTGLALTPDEVAWAEELCRERMFEYRINPTMIRIVR